MFKSIKKILFIYLFFRILFGTCSFAELSNNLLKPNIADSKEKQSTILEDSKIKLAVMSYWPLDAKGTNIHYKLIDLLNKYGGLNIIPVTFENYEIAYVQALNGDNIDGIMNLGWSDRRFNQDFYMTKQYDYVPYFLIAKEGLKIENMKDLNGKIVYIEKNSSLNEVIKGQINPLKITQDIQEAQAILSFDRKKELYAKNNFKVVNTLYDKYGEVSIGISKKKYEQYLKIEEALAKIPQSELDSLDNTKINFSKNELLWLNENKTVNFFHRSDFIPLEFKNDLGDYQGIMSDIINIIKNNSNLKLNPVDKLLDDIFVVSLAVKKDEDKKYNYTETILSIPYVFVGRYNDNLNNGFKNLENKTVGIVKNTTFNLTQTVSELEQKLNYRYFDDLKSAFKALKDGSVYIVIIDKISAEYYFKKLNIENDLRISYKTIFNMDICMAVEKNAPEELLSILNKTIRNLDETKKNDIIHKWTNIKVENKIDWGLIFKIIGAAFIIIIFIFISNYKLKSLVKQRTEELNNKNIELKNNLSSFDRNVVFIKMDIKGNIIHLSEAFCKLSQFSKDELLDKSYNFLVHKDNPGDLLHSIWKSLNLGIPIAKEIKSTKKNGSIYWTQSLFSPEFNEKDMIGFTVISHDITDKKEVESLKDTLEIKVIERTKDLNEAKKEIEISHKNTKDSIQYASLIQQAVIPDDNIIKNFLTDHFVWWSPKDIVGGDIFLFETINENECVFFVIDCAGHGVPGAFVTMLVKAIEIELFTEIQNNKYEIDTSFLMEQFNKKIKQLLHQENEDSISNAGFDGAIVYINKSDKILKFTGALTELFYAKNDTIDSIKGDRQSVGYRQSDANFKYTQNIIEFDEQMRFYISTDGFLDQKGGEKGFSFGKKRFKALIQSNYTQDMGIQKNIFMDELESYKNDYFRVDDITVFGWRV